MKIYVASSYVNYPEVKRWQHRLKLQGHTISHDWTPSETPEVSAPSETTLPMAEQRRFALEDLAGVDAADIVWVLAPAQGGCGCWVELGYALARGKFVIVSGSARRSIFETLANVYVESHEMAAKVIG